MIVFAADWVLPVDAPPLERGAVAFEEGRIVADGPLGELGPADVAYSVPWFRGMFSTRRESPIGTG